jgi:hypothetical protein
MKEDSFENQWKDALEDATYAPPPEIWDRVEAELKKKKRSGFLIWKNPFLLSGVAAALALVLGTLFLFNNSSNIEGVSKNEQVKERSVTSSEEENSTENVIKKDAQPASSAVAGKNLAKSDLAGRDKIASAHLKESYVTSTEDLSRIASAGETQEKNSSVEDKSLSRRMTSGDVVAEMKDEVAENNLTPLFSEGKLSFDRLDGIQIAALNNSFQKPTNKIDISVLGGNETVKKERSGWFGVLASNAPFNPNFSTPSLHQQANAAIMKSEDTFYQSGVAGSNGQPLEPTGSYTNTNRRDPSSNFKIGSALSYGVGFGKRIKKRLAIESGVRFTTAQTSHVYNVYAVDKKTGNFSSYLLANYALSNDLKNSDVLISVNGSSQITYNFLSIPILLNYNLINLGRFNVNAVGGLSSEILLSGNVAHPKDVDQSFNAGNSNFKAFNIAGLGGVRLSYALTKQLDVNLGSTYQHFLNSGIESSTSASFRPSMLGLNMGISVRR